MQDLSKPEVTGYKSGDLPCKCLTDRVFAGVDNCLGGLKFSQIKLSFCLIVLTSLALAYFVFYHCGAGPRYALEYNLALGLISVTLALRYIKWGLGISSQCLYGLTLYLACKSILQGILLPCADPIDFLTKLNPNALVYLSQTFAPLPV